MFAVIPDSFYSRHHSWLDLESHHDNSTLCVPILHKISEGILKDNRCNDLLPFQTHFILAVILNLFQSLGKKWHATQCTVPNQYCFLNWTKSSWKKGETVPTASAGATGTLYGKCQRLPVFYTHPYFEQEVDNNGMFKLEKKCPPKMYCHLQWKDINCTAAGAEIMGKVYGACALWDETNTRCPKPTEE